MHVAKPKAWLYTCAKYTHCLPGAGSSASVVHAHSCSGSHNELGEHMPLIADDSDSLQASVML